MLAVASDFPLADLAAQNGKARRLIERPAALTIRRVRQRNR
jgi:hypothetical protein